MMASYEGANECSVPSITIWISITSTCLALVFLVGFYNIRKYLVLLKKYTVYPLTLCYIAC